jgi:hypothetical protein
MKGIGKCVPVHFMKMYRESRGIALLILTSALYGIERSTAWLNHFTPEKETRYPLNAKLDGLKSLSKRFEKV